VGGSAGGASCRYRCLHIRKSCRIAVGQAATWSVQAWCYDSNHNQVDDTVTLSVTGNPTSGGTTLSIRPNPVHTFHTAVSKTDIDCKHDGWAFRPGSNRQRSGLRFLSFQSPQHPIGHRQADQLAASRSGRAKAERRFALRLRLGVIERKSCGSVQLQGRRKSRLSRSSRSVRMAKPALCG
jgi:hypothetical protein